MDRRDFIKTTGIMAGGVLLTGLAPRSAYAASPWDQVPAILARIVPPTFPDRTFDITAYGAKPDNTTDCTAAFKNAIAACNAAGGGTVLVPGTGSFRTGKIHLLSNVNLHVNAGGTIRFRSDAGSYLPNVFTRWQGIECYNYSPFIYAYGQTNVAITGPGTIDGNAAAGPWFGFDDQRGPDWDALQQMAVDGVPVNQRQFGDGHYLKPNMIQLYNCTNILIEDVNIKNPAMWTIHPVLSRNVTVRNVKVYSRGAMVDGCDPESCADVLIEGCSFDTGDDGTVIKSGRDIDGRRVGVPSENIVIRNNKYYGRWGAITVGSEMSGGVRNVFAQDNQIFPGSSYHSFYAVYIKTNNRRGGVVDGIHVRNLTGGPCDRGGFFIDMNYSLTGPGYGPIVNPVVQNITVDGLNIDTSPFAIKLSGSSASHIKNVTISNSTFTNITTAAPQISNADNVVLNNVRINGTLYGNAPTAVRYEAENATISTGSVVANNHLNYSGTGFVDTANAVGSYVEWTVNAATAGTASLLLRYANGTTTNRPMDISVNGTVVAAGKAFNGTGNWDTWANATISAPLNAGSNTVRVTATTANGCPNLDYLEVTGP
ncbi:glycosyl hydrolase family 28 protein [Planotetraspora sp. A-T 1434]|uniref:glycosyl hydrolase family 28 protein n=1 Tax=Planotetraspora sp. A-T 1434 TaxID=2979219 RepID=UPI0021BE32F9|nr:glycosyl hydrolase family 28 protein [Planotetraspora sp. A-T 1434]MCT9930262.1 glycosyl hydrolase family 28 protein [Planotetraspora sp. A-T 1434]